MMDSALPRRIVRAGLVLAVILTGTLLARSHASAHAGLVNSNPSDKQVLATAPAMITLTFSENLAASPGSFIYVSTGGKDASGGDSMISATDTKTMTIPLMANAGAGQYNVFWKSTSADDGGVTFGRYVFFVGTPSAADVAAAPAAASVEVPDDATDKALSPAPGAAVTSTQITASYTVALSIGPVATMLTPDQAAGAHAGEVIVPMPGMAMPSMDTMMLDNGMMANRHLEVHFTSTASGQPVTDMVPAVSITSEPGGSTRTLDNVMAMYDVATGMSDLHFGQNVYLPDGTYTITVTLNGETATFAHLTVGGMSTGTMSPGG